MFISLINIAKLKSYNKVKANGELTNKEAKKVKFRLLRPLSKAHNIVVYICSLSSYIAYFRKLARRIILINNCIKWNS